MQMRRRPCRILTIHKKNLNPSFEEVDQKPGLFKFHRIFAFHFCSRCCFCCRPIVIDWMIMITMLERRNRNGDTYYYQVNDGLIVRPEEEEEFDKKE